MRACGIRTAVLTRSAAQVRLPAFATQMLGSPAGDLRGRTPAAAPLTDGRTVATRMTGKWAARGAELLDYRLGHWAWAGRRVFIEQSADGADRMTSLGHEADMGGAGRTRANEGGACAVSVGSGDGGRLAAARCGGQRAAVVHEP